VFNTRGAVDQSVGITGGADESMFDWLELACTKEAEDGERLARYC
jgi:hypothetical protein